MVNERPQPNVKTSPLSFCVSKRDPRPPNCPLCTVSVSRSGERIPSQGSREHPGRRPVDPTPPSRRPLRRNPRVRRVVQVVHQCLGRDPGLVETSCCTPEGRSPPLTLDPTTKASGTFAVLPGLRWWLSSAPSGWEETDSPSDELSDTPKTP